jgi:hypothetical protein
MVTPTYEEVIKLADALPPEERLRLIAHLATGAQADIVARKRRRRWTDLAGTAPYPALGEDAQAWVSRSRQESDDAREAQSRDRR